MCGKPHGKHVFREPVGDPAERVDVDVAVVNLVTLNNVYGRLSYTVMVLILCQAFR